MQSTLTALRTVLSTFSLLLLASIPGHAADRVYPSPEAVEPLAIGKPVPEARVKTVRGVDVDLAAIARERGALLVFYRGGW